MAPLWRWALGGAAAAALALGAGEMVAALLGGGSPIAAVGALVIDLQPPGGKDLMVALFGTNDKLALEIMTAGGALLVGAVAGALGRRSSLLPTGAIVAFALIALAAITLDPTAGLTAAALVVVAAAGAGLTGLHYLLPPPAAEMPRHDAPPEHVTEAPVARRSFLLLSATALALGGTLTVIGRMLTSRVPVVSTTREVPAANPTVAPLGDAADFEIDGLAPIVVPNEDFYRIDTRLTVPSLDASAWRLRIHGMVEREMEIGYDELLAMPLVERYVTIACVSNEVGGHLVGNAAWTGTPLLPLLERAGIRPGATQVVGRSFDGWTCGFPTEHLRGAGVGSMIAVAMNGEPLPAKHGYPARLIVPGLYGYVSATKWLTEIELNTLDGFDAYWVPLGWAKQAPILTQSRIDVPRAGASVATGAVQVAGVAWAPTRGIRRVEVQADDGNWQEAELSQPLSDAAWVQWRTTVDLAAGQHVLRVRATDGNGETQTDRRTPAIPDGARGLHELTVTAT